MLQEPYFLKGAYSQNRIYAERARKRRSLDGAQSEDHHRGLSAKQAPAGMLAAIRVGLGSVQHRSVMSRDHLSLPLYEGSYGAILTVTMQHTTLKANS